MIDRPTPINPADDELRDPRLDALWRALPAEKPPLELDVALRAAARREAGAGPQSSGNPTVAEATRPERWWWPLAAAATIGAIAIGMLQLVNDRSNERDAVSDMPRAPASRAGATKSAPALAPQGRETGAPVQAEAVNPRESRATVNAEAVPPPEQAPRKATRRAEKESPAALDARTAASPAGTDDTRPNAPAGQALSKSSGNIGASLPPPAPAEPMPLRADAPGAAVASDQAAPSSKPRSAPARAEVATGAAQQQRESDGIAAQPSPTAKVDAVRDRNERVVSERAARPVAEWIALIRRLRDEGAIGEASRELVAFREAHPDAERLLPPDLRDWRPPKP